ncbi:MAG: LacI family transcriptional regulator, partial [Allorhizobium sp.]
NEAMIEEGFKILKTPRPPAITHLVQPMLVKPRTALTGPLDALKDVD